MKRMWEVVTENGTSVFEGNKRQCNAYLKQALEKGSTPGFLSIQRVETVKEVMKHGK